MATRKITKPAVFAAVYEPISEAFDNVGAPVELDSPGYNKLAAVLVAAFEQAAIGKGHERHANDLPFHEQPMATINRQLKSIDGMIFQAHKKSLEAKSLPAGRAQAELLGAINYLAGAVIALDSWAASTLPPAPGEKE